MLYTLAGYTGLRCSELASLTRSSFDLTEGTVTVNAGYSKRRREDVLPLHPELVKLFAEYLQGKTKDGTIWPGTWSKQASAKMLRLDLAEAGIPYRDEAGRVFDFHATRGQFISELARQGVHPKTAQVLARLNGSQAAAGTPSRFTSMPRPQRRRSWTGSWRAAGTRRRSR
jgi:integrase